MFQAVSLALLAGAISFQTGQFPLSKSDVVPASVCLVKAEAVTSKSFKVIHVYAGDSNAKGKTFAKELFKSSGPLSFGGLNPLIRIPVKPGELGIWWLERKKGTEELDPFPTVISLAFLNPALKDGSKDGNAYYEFALANAETVEMIYRAADKDRLKVIDDLVKSGDERKAGSALRLLNNVREPKVTDYLLTLMLDKSLPFSVQLDINDLLANKKKGWAGSPEQLKILDRWSTGSWRDAPGVEWDASNEKSLAYLIATVNQGGDFSVSERLDLMIKGLSNPARSDRFGRQMIAEVKTKDNWRRWADKGQQQREKEQGFAYLLKRIQEEKTLLTRIAAAKLLSLFAPLSPEQEMAVRGLLKEKRLDKELAGEIEKILQSK